MMSLRQYSHLSNNAIQYINHGFILASSWLLCIYMTLNVSYCVWRQESQFLGPFKWALYEFLLPLLGGSTCQCKLRKEELIPAHGWGIILPNREGIVVGAGLGWLRGVHSQEAESNA